MNEHLTICSDQFITSMSKIPTRQLNLHVVGSLCHIGYLLSIRSEKKHKKCTMLADTCNEAEANTLMEFSPKIENNSPHTLQTFDLVWFQ